MPHLDPTLPTLAELTRMVEASWLTAKPQPTPWPVIERRSLRRLIARVRLHRRRAARCAAPGLRLPASASGDDWRVGRPHLAGSAGADSGEAVRYRNKHLLEACRLLPCQHCGKDDGTVCAAHSNWSSEGKGMGLKASDAAVAALCFTCHRLLDQGSRLDRQEKRVMWVEACMRTYVKLVELGMLVLTQARGIR